MSALNESLTDREVHHEYDLHSPLWETDHMADPDICKLRAETSRTRATRVPTGIGRARAYHPHSARAQAEDHYNDPYEAEFGPYDQEEE